MGESRGHVLNLQRPDIRSSLSVPSVKNSGPDTITVSSGDFSIRDSEGNRFDPIINHGTSYASWSYLTDLDKNQSISRTIYFEVPLTAKNLVLYYDFGNVSPSIRLAYWNID